MIKARGIGEFQVVLHHGLKHSPGWLLGSSLQNPGKVESEKTSLLQHPLQNLGAMSGRDCCAMEQSPGVCVLSPAVALVKTRAARRPDTPSSLTSSAQGQACTGAPVWEAPVGQLEPSVRPSVHAGVEEPLSGF